jgi:peptide chain release factor subunit 3
MADVEVSAAARGVCVERFSQFRSLGRFTLRHQGETVASGIVTEIPGHEDADAPQPAAAGAGSETAAAAGSG